MSAPDEKHSVPRAILVSLDDLRDGSVALETLEAAFGPDSLGILIVRDLPPEFARLRSKVLSYSSYLANLEEAELAKLENAQAKYNIGWSCGKEQLASGRYDTLKGSFYVQPVHDDRLFDKARRLYPDATEFTSPNIWPDEATLPGFQRALESLCRLIIDTAALVAQNCDRYGVAKLDGYRPGTLESMVRGSISHKARLLHYWPSVTVARSEDPVAPDSGVGTDDAWCATHKDLGALTGLTSQMFIDESQNPPSKSRHDRDSDGTLPSLPELHAHPDPAAGLWIQDRTGRTTQVHIPRDCLAFQTGEALELITRGTFRAVPHFVRGARAGDAGAIARNTLAVFTQPNLWDMVDEQRDFATFGRSTLEGYL